MKKKEKKTKINSMVELWINLIQNEWEKRNTTYLEAKCIPLQEVNDYYVVKLAYEIAMQHPKKTKKLMRVELEKLPDEVFGTWGWRQSKPYWGKAFTQATDAVWGPIAPMVREVY
jgi:hypothetical protein